MLNSRIDWCDSTWNPITGCLHGCEYCYARTIAERFRARECGQFEEEKINGNYLYDLNSPLLQRNKDGSCINAPYPYGFSPTLYRYRLNEYIGKKGRNIFVCSMADLFGSWVPDSWIEEVFAACEKAQQHNYLFLTKNPERYMEFKNLPANKNIWYGTSITNPRTFFFYGKDVNTFLSIEPILEPFGKFEDDLKSGFVKWIIVGAETGRRKDKVVPKRDWIEQIVEDCRKYEIPLFMKSSLADIWGEPLIQEFPKELKRS